MTKLVNILTEKIAAAIADPQSKHAAPLARGLFVGAIFDDSERVITVNCWRVGIEPATAEIRTVGNHVTQALHALGYTYTRSEAGGKPEKKLNGAGRACFVVPVRFWIQLVELI